MLRTSLVLLALSAVLGGCVTGGEGPMPMTRKWEHKSLEQRQTRPDQIMGRPLYTTPGDIGGRGGSPLNVDENQGKEPGSPGGSLRERVSW